MMARDVRITEELRTPLARPSRLDPSGSRREWSPIRRWSRESSFAMALPSTAVIRRRRTRSAAGLIRRNRYRDFVRIGALDIARIHRSHVVVVDLAAGNRAIGVRRTRLRRRVQLCERPAGFRTAIHKVPCHVRGAAIPSERHGMLRGGGNSSSGQSDIQGRVRRVAGDRQCSADTARHLRVEVHRIGFSLTGIKDHVRCRAAQNESGTADRHVRDAGVRVSRARHFQLIRARRSNGHVSKTQARCARRQLNRGGRGVPTQIKDRR